MSRLARLRRTPMVHFVVLGSVLALGRALLPRAGAEPSHVIVVTSELTDRLGASMGAAPGARVARAPLEAWLDDEVLYREGLQRGLGWNPGSIARLLQVGRFLDEHDGDDEAAVLSEVRRLGLDRQDAVVRAQVVAHMRLRLHADARHDEPTDADLQRYVAANRERFTQPARVTFAHVFVRRDHGAAAEALVQTLTARARSDAHAVAHVLRLGDAFQAGDRFREWSPREVEGLLGPEVRRVAMTQPERVWSAPVQSPYGWHLLWIERRRAEAVAPRDVVRRAWRADEARRGVDARIRELRAAYRVEIEPAVAARLAPRAQGRG